MGKYEEALGRAKEAVKKGMVSQSFVDDIFGVQESEDERIKKALLRCCDDWEKGQFGCMKKEDVPLIRAYLEKQKEQKEQKASIVEKLREISTPADEDWFEIQKRWEKEDEQKPFSQEVFDAVKHEALWGEQQPAEWSEEDEENLQDLCELLSQEDLDFYNLQTRENFISWLKSLRPQSEQMISEDTEVLMTKLVNLLKSYRIGEETATTLANRIADTYGAQRYMDGLCDSGKLHWKPSEEQMEAFTNAIHFLAKNGFKDYLGGIESLYNDLKKL